jgi:cytochrome c556
MNKLIAAVMGLAALGAVAALAQTPAPAPAAAPAAPPAPPTERQAVMQSNRTASAAYAEITISVMQPAAAKAAAQTLIDNGAKIATLFGPNTDRDDPRALPAVWTDAAGFKALNDRFIANARKLITAIPDRVNMAVAMRDVQADCAECHKTYRVAPAAAPGGRGGRGRGAAADAPAAPAAAN